MQDSLRNKTVKGTFWSLMDNIAGQGITFLVGLVLARLLTPEECGLIAVIMIFIAIFNSIVDSGFSTALIRKNNAAEIDYNTVFIFNLAISILLFVALFFAATPIATFFKQPELIPLTRVMACIVIINAFAIIQRTRLVKAIDFKTQAKISVISSVISGFTGIGMALKGYGAWSLVGQQITRQLMNTVFLWIYNKWLPKIQFSVKSFKELFSFGWKLLVSGLIDTIWKEIYQVVIGRFYTTETLGYYDRANQFKKIFADNLTNVIQRVSYPVLSVIQDERERLKQSYQKVIKITMYVTFICMLGLSAIAKPLIVVLIGEKWLPCVGFLQIICFSGMLYPLHAINLNMLKVKGRSDLFLKLEIIKKSIGVIPLLLGIFVDIYWMLVGSVILGFISYFLNSYYSGREINYSTKEQVKDILPSFLIALIMAACVYLISFADINLFYMLGIQLVVGFLLTILLSKLFKSQEYKEMRQIVFSFINKHGK